MSSTKSVFHLDRSALNPEAWLNKPDIKVTPFVFHLEMSALKDVVESNAAIVQQLILCNGEKKEI